MTIELRIRALFFHTHGYYHIINYNVNIDVLMVTSRYIRGENEMNYRIEGKEEFHILLKVKYGYWL
ncbi:hypothetical protein BS101_02770 [Clostridium kluyveri]|uniref:Uncharacterized protein n=1 Tax=Clostridium kluyveri TaxID=1534 RepID=A0A1L5F418_CLOKL|nr:hypothetical protein BS101_02770 [Clostridium kluyveri]